MQNENPMGLICGTIVLLALIAALARGCELSYYDCTPPQEHTDGPRGTT